MYQVFSQEQLQLIFSKLLEWPAVNLFPVLDILRMIVLHPSGASKFATEGNQILPKLLDIGFKSQPLPANQLLILRLIGNMFRWESLQPILKLNDEQILGIIANCVHSDNKNIRITFSTILLNFSALFLQDKFQEGKIQIISILAEVLRNEKEDEVIYRSLVALGTLLWNDDQAKSLARDLEMTQSLKTHQSSSSSSSKVKECANELLLSL